MPLWFGKDHGRIDVERSWASRHGFPLSPATRRSQLPAGSPAQTRAMMYAFGPGGCQGDPSHLTQFSQELANFLLVRGEYAWLGHGWGRGAWLS